jgi:hypothetical protein
VRSPASSVLRNAPTPARPSRRASFPSRDRTAPALGLRSSEPRVRGLRAWAVRSGARPDSMTRRRSGLPGSWRTLVRTCPALRPRRARHAWPFATCRHGLPSFLTTSALAPSYLSRLHHAACTLPVYASQGGSLRHHATRGSGWWPASTGRASSRWVPSEGFRDAFHSPSTSLPPPPGFAWRTSRHKPGNGDISSNIGPCAPTLPPQPPARAVRPARRRPVEDYLRMQGRYRHLFEPERNAEAIARLQADVDRYWAAADADPDTRASVTG